MIMTERQFKRTTGGIFLSIVCVVGFAVAIKLAMAMSDLNDNRPIETVRPSLPQPSPVRLPNDVIQLQMEALRNNSTVYPDAGIEVAYLFTSPEGKARFQSLDEFAELYHGPVYNDLLGHKATWFGPVEVVNGMAHVPVMIRTASEEEAGYIFVLSRQADGEMKDCWLTDRVIRIQ